MLCYSLNVRNHCEDNWGNVSHCAGPPRDDLGLILNGTDTEGSVLCLFPY